MLLWWTRQVRKKWGQIYNTMPWQELRFYYIVKHSILCIYNLSHTVFLHIQQQKEMLWHLLWLNVTINVTIIMENVVRSIRMFWCLWRQSWKMINHNWSTTEHWVAGYILHEKARIRSIRQQYQGHNLMARRNCSILTKGKSFVTKRRGMGRGRFGLIYMFLVTHLSSYLLFLMLLKGKQWYTTPTRRISC